MVYNECFQNGYVSNRETNVHTKYYAKLHKFREKYITGQSIFPHLTNVNTRYLLQNTNRPTLLESACPL